jgi:hypothetical protein
MAGEKEEVSTILTHNLKISWEYLQYAVVDFDCNL